MRKSNTLLVLASMALALLLACMAAILTSVPSLAQTATVTLVGAGDIASCDYTADSATARLVGRIPGTVFTLGDNVYPDGTIKQFRECYEPTWGKYKKRTKPSVGNHEYRTPDASGYFNYFGARAGAPSKGYYSYRRGGWHIVVLNSNCSKVGGCGRRSPQGRWLRRDLANHQARCTLAYFHHPLYSTGDNTATPQVKPFWKILYDRGADVILAGHAHRYERFAPITPDGVPSTNGIRQFIVGTGGAPGGVQYGADDPNMQVKKTDTPGVLKLNLRAGSYRWKFVSVNNTFADRGNNQCH